MKFYRVYSNDDPAQSDTLFPTKKEALAYMEELKDPDPNGYTVDLSVIEIKRLNKAAVCEIYARAMR